MVLIEKVTARLAPLNPEHPAAGLSAIPALTLALFVLTGALVAGVAEEAAFRGYMQGPIERRHGPVVAILVTGLFFGFAHFTHPEATFAWLPYYMAVAAVYGMLAYFTDSILPSLALHAGGNFLGSLPALAGGAVRSTPALPAARGSFDQSFWVIVVALAASLVGTVAAFIFLAREARQYRHPRQSLAADAAPT